MSGLARRVHKQPRGRDPLPNLHYCNLVRAPTPGRFPEGDDPGRIFVANRLVQLRADLPASAAGPLSRPVRWPVRSLYIHVPFCFHKCHYCDFYSLVDTQDRQAAFVDALDSELAALAEHARTWRGRGSAGTRRPALATVFVGGGTPTLLRQHMWEQLLRALHGHFELLPGAEFTVECNPETATADLMRILASGGVNRISIGAQSFDERRLKTLERWHDPGNVARAIDLAADAGIERRSIDLIFGIPGQSIDDWRADLERALALDPPIEHLSCYALTYEPGTAMTARLNRGEFVRADEDTEAEMYSLAVSLLCESGFDRYEVSNFSRPGAECRHNLAYWRQDQWLAAGPSASAHVGGARWKNVPRLADWMDGVRTSGGYSPIIDYEPPDPPEGPRRALAERIMTGLRLREGLDSRSLLADAGDMTGARLGRCARKHEAGGLLSITESRWMLTDRGFLHADAIAAEMMAAL